MLLWALLLRLRIKISQHKGAIYHPLNLSLNVWKWTYRQLFIGWGHDKVKSFMCGIKLDIIWCNDNVLKHKYYKETHTGLNTWGKPEISLSLYLWNHVVSPVYLYYYMHFSPVWWKQRILALSAVPLFSLIPHIAASSRQHSTKRQRVHHMLQWHLAIRWGKLCIYALSVEFVLHLFPFSQADLMNVDAQPQSCRRSTQKKEKNRMYMC